MSDQLSLPLSGSDDEVSLPPRLGFPIPTEGGRPFDDESRFFEPWWPGAHAQLWRIGDRVEVRTEWLSDPLAAFPELHALGHGLSVDGLIVEGTLLALDAEGRPDAALLRRRLADEGEQVEDADGAFVASDLLYLEGRSMAKEPYAVRRQRLASVLPDSDRRVLGRGLAGEGVTLGHAVAALGLDSISARRLDAGWKPGPAGDRWLHLSVTEPPTMPTRPLLVLLEKLPLED